MGAALVPRRLLLATVILLSALASASAFLHVSQQRSNFLGRYDHDFSSAPQSHTTTRYPSVLLWMGKGDGKKKRKKKSATPSAAPAPAAASADNVQMQPMRVTSNSNVSVKRQIRWAQMNKEYAKQQANPGYRKKKHIRTKYRRTWDEEEIEQKAEERKKRGQDPNWDVILNQTKADPLVIVDGYNIIYQWPRLKKHMNKGDLQRARRLLVDDLENLQSIKGWRIECVFDGTRKSTVGPLGHGPRGSDKPTAMDQRNNIDQSKHGVRVVFTGRGIEADSYIESRCSDAKQVTDGQYTGSFIVATDDVMIRMAGQNAGALCMGAQRFVDELKAMKKAVEYRVEAAVAKANGQSARPAKLRGTSFHNFGRGSVLIEDKAAQKAERKAEQEAARLAQEKFDREMNDKLKDVLPDLDWAVVPKLGNQSAQHTRSENNP